jgi:glycosyltransferase involved in cell wall biosynthesis
MRTIAIFHPSADLYGADRILVHAINALPPDLKPMVHLRTTGPLEAFLAEHAPSASVHIVPDMPVIYRAIFTPTGILEFARQWIRFAGWLRRRHKKQAFELAYVNTLSCSFLLPILWMLGIPRFIHVHEMIDRPRLVGKVTAQLAGLFANRIVCVSQAVESCLVGHSSSVWSKCVVIHNGILPVHAPVRRARERVNFTLFGRIKPDKGQWVLVDALNELPVELLDELKVTMMGGVVAGQEELLEELRGRIAAKGRSNMVRIEGFTKDISTAMAETDVCLVPSLMRDPFPTTVLEAMSSGRPVIATDHGGAREAVMDHVTGRLIPAGDPRRLAQAMEGYLRDRVSINVHGAAGRDRYAERFTLVAFTQRWSQFITETRNPGIGQKFRPLGSAPMLCGNQGPVPQASGQEAGIGHH